MPLIFAIPVFLILLALWVGFVDWCEEGASPRSPRFPEPGTYEPDEVRPA